LKSVWDCELNRAIPFIINIMDENQTFNALVVEETAPGQFTRRVVQRHISDLPQGEVLVRVKYSSLNYKDALSANGNKGVTRQFPHTPGIDMAGVVESSEDKNFRPGDEVIITAGEMGVNSPGGFGQYVCVPGDCLVPLPHRLSLRESMAYGTAGFTAALSVHKLMKAGIRPELGEIIVTGATGGVGTIATGILAKEKYEVTASTGKLENNKLLIALGAKHVISRDEVNDTSGKPLLHTRWAGGIDSVGGNILSTVLRSTQPNGVVTACGNAASAELPITVYPFILRGITLIGIDALRPSHEERVKLWDKLAHEWKLSTLNEMVREVPLSGLDEEIQRMLEGKQTGRVIVNME
jgi:acrylyl-CoA reductase (NADPH)